MGIDGCVREVGSEGRPPPTHTHPHIHTTYARSQKQIPAAPALRCAPDEAALFGPVPPCDLRGLPVELCLQREPENLHLRDRVSRSCVSESWYA